MLGQGAATLHQRTGAQICEHGPGDGAGRDTVVMLEVPVLDTEQRRHQASGHLFQPHEHAVLAMIGIDPADQRRIQTQQSLLPVTRSQPAHPTATESNAHPTGRLLTVPELEAAGVNAKIAALAGVGAGPAR